MDFNTLWLAISKLATLLVDRRLWVALLFMGGTVLGAGEWAVMPTSFLRILWKLFRQCGSAFLVLFR